MINCNESGPGMKTWNLHPCGLSGNYKFSGKTNEGKIVLARKGDSEYIRPNREDAVTVLLLANGKSNSELDYHLR